MTHAGTSQLVRWLVIVALAGASGVMVSVSMRANYLFGYGFGQTPEKAQVFGYANVAADLWKVTGLIVISGLWRAGQRQVALTLTPIWVLCLLWGLAGAVGVYAQDRTQLIGGREAKTASYKELEHELADIDGKLQTFVSQRTVAQIDAAIAAVLARPVLIGERVRGTVAKLSNDCSIEDRRTAEACVEVAGLREERAGAEERARLEKRKTELRPAIARLREGGAAIAADPVAELFAWLSRGHLSVRDIGFGFPLVFAFLIEIVSAFGPAGVVAYAEVTKPAEDSRLQHAASGSSMLMGEVHEDDHGSVMQWLVERGLPGDGAIAAEDLHADYELWCRSNGAVPAKFGAFVMTFDFVRENPESGLADKIRKFGRRYYGIALLPERGS